MSHLLPGQFIGTVQRRREVSGLLLTETLYAPASRIPPHAHQNAYLCFVCRGSYTEVYGHRTRSCGPSSLALHPAEELHAEQFAEVEAQSFNIEPTDIWLSRFRDYAPLLRNPADFKGGPLALAALRLYREFQMTDDVSALAIEGLFLELLAGCARNRTPARIPSWLVQVRELVSDRFTERLALGDIADAVGVHPVHLCRVFRQQYGCTLGDYVRKLRIDFASRQLLTSQKSLVEIALAAGFADQSHLTKAFRRSTGMTPAEFRRHLRSC